MVLLLIWCSEMTLSFLVIAAASCKHAAVAKQNHTLLKMKFLIYETPVW